MYTDNFCFKQLHFIIITDDKDSKRNMTKLFSHEGVILSVVL